MQNAFMRISKISYTMIAGIMSIGKSKNAKTYCKNAKTNVK